MKFPEDQCLPGLRLLLDPDRFLKHFGPSLGLRSVEIANLRYKPETSCLASYVEKRPTGTNYLHAKAFHRNDWRHRSAKFGPDVWKDDELAIAVFRFPVDAGLTAVSVFARDPQAFADRVLFDNQSLGQVRNHEVLAYKPNRRFVARLDFDSGKSAVLKVHDQTTFESVKGSAKALKKLPNLLVPERLGQSNRHCSIIYEWIEGQTCSLTGTDAAKRQEILDAVFDFRSQLSRYGDWRKNRLPFRSVNYGVAELAAFVGRLGPPLASLSKSIAAQLLCDEPKGFLPELVHGDFYDRQLILGDQGVRVCDFDRVCLSDPTVDLANLVAKLRYDVIVGELVPEVVDNIDHQIVLHLEDSATEDSVQRYRFNVASCLFRLISTPFRSGMQQWQIKTELILQAVQRELDKRKTPKERTSAKTSRLTQTILADQSLAFLHDVVNSGAWEPVLMQVGPIRDRFGEFRFGKAVAKRHKKGRRCLIEFDLQTDDGSRHSLLGKANARRFDRYAYKTQTELFLHQGFDRDSQDLVSVPETIGYDSELQIWFQEKVNASSATELIHRGRLGEITERVANAITKLHQSSFVSGRRHHVFDELRILGDRLNMAKQLMPNEANAIESVLDDCIEIAKLTSEGPIVPIHRDFYQDQILMGDERTWLIDLDLVSMGPAAIDVGNFVAHLAELSLRLHGNPEHWFAEETALIENYLSLNKGCKRFDIEAYKAISFARHIFISWTKPDRQRFAMSTIEVAKTLTTKVLRSQLSFQS